jgi:hypothetical protein
MLIHPTVERLRALGLAAMADAFIELQNAPDAAELTREGIVNLTRSSRPSWPLFLERGQPFRRAKDFSAPNRRATDGRRIPPLLKLTMPRRPYSDGQPRALRADSILPQAGCQDVGNELKTTA